MTNTWKRSFQEISKSHFFRYGLPFFLFLITGSYGLIAFTSIRYKYRKQTPYKETLKKQNPELKITDKRESLEDIYEKSVKSKSYDDWENIRGPRFYEPETLNIKNRKKITYKETINQKFMKECINFNPFNSS